MACRRTRASSSSIPCTAYLTLKVANCLDGAVLVASLLEAFGVNTALVFTQKAGEAHAFVAWESRGGVGDWAHLETNGFTTQPFAKARDSADATAAAFAAEDAHAPGSIFTRLAVRELRAQGIAPLE